MALGFTALTSDFNSYKAENARRHTFYSVPNGATSLVGLLSLMDSEPTDGPTFGWHEDRFREKTCKTTRWHTGTAGPWQTTGASNQNVSLALTNGSSYRLYVTSQSDSIHNWSVGETITVARNPTAAEPQQITGRITNILLDPLGSGSTTTAVFTVLITGPTVTVLDASTNDDCVVQSAGVAFAEGSRSPSGQAIVFPIKPTNNTQIFRKAVKFSRTMLNQPMFFDSRGAAPNMLRRAAANFMIELENACLFGQKAEDATTDDDGTPTVVRRMGGIRYFLEQYEAAGGGTAGYRPGGAAVTLVTDNEKRIIPVTSTITPTVWKTYLERMFRVTINSSNEKLVLCGSGFLAAVLDYYRGLSSIRINRDFEETHKLSFTLHTIETDFGTLHLKSHPRFNDQLGRRYDAHILDVPNLKLRPMVDADMHRKEDIGENDFDGRKDEFFGEIGLEVNYPESHMIIEGLTAIQA